MAQNFAGLSILSNEVSYKDSVNLDAFSRLRVSTPTTLFDAQQTYNLNPLVFEQIVSGTGATLAHDSTNRQALITFSSTPTGGESYVQSYEYIRYQPSKSQLVFVTFNMLGGVADTLKFAGLSDGDNGFEFQLNGTTAQFKLYSNSDNGDQTITQSNWNLDKLDGTGASGITLDLTKEQILVIDFQALYVGRVRVGFDIDGVIVPAHQFLHANDTDYPYIATANLPVRCGMTCTGTVSTAMNFVCCAVVSEGGVDDTIGYEFISEANVTASNGTRTYMQSIRPKTTFNSITNRSSISLVEVELLVTGNSPVFWELCVGQALTSTSYSDINSTYSAMEVDTAGSLSGSPSIVIDGGYVPASNQSKGSQSKKLTGRYPITLDASGAVRDLGTITLLVTGIGGNTACRGIIKIKEIR